MCELIAFIICTRSECECLWVNGHVLRTDVCIKMWFYFLILIAIKFKLIVNVIKWVIKNNKLLFNNFNNIFLYSGCVHIHMFKFTHFALFAFLKYFKRTNVSFVLRFFSDN